ncbi:MAG: oxygen-independent coproporphyrinogen III oxidase [Opitutales bacterium]|nr:oxygen-independent coproporphyrinogen III oxidase [Opitutales bacterium]
MNNLKDLILKYETPGPRYTSYPTAPHFSEAADARALAQDAVLKDAPRSLYVHIPFCKTACLFCGCSTSVCTDLKKADEYLSLVELELELWKDFGLKKCPLEQIHFGGGTPNFLIPEQILRLGQIIKKHFDISKTCEFSAELDPRTLTQEKVEAFAKIGVNRASIGVQDTNLEVQKAISRIQPQEMNLRVFEWLRASGIEKINIDLMYGLPLQTRENFRSTIENAVSLRPDRIALFNYAHVPWMKAAQKALEKYPRPQGAEKVELFEDAMAAFEAAGFEYIGLDHFALPHDELIKARENGTLQRNFQGYSTRKGLDGFGVGLTSISQTENSYRQNSKLMPEYEKSVKSGVLPIARGVFLTPEDHICRAAIMEIMCMLRLNFAEFENKFPVRIKDEFPAAIPALKEMESDGLLKLTNSGLEITKTGRLFIRNIAMLFDKRLGAEKSIYSKTL